MPWPCILTFPIPPMPSLTPPCAGSLPMKPCATPVWKNLCRPCGRPTPQGEEFRDSGYVGAADTSKSLLNWWFKEPHLMAQADGTMVEFNYFFAQREALETIIYLYDVVGARDKYDLMRFDSAGHVSASMFDESWLRLVIEMATVAARPRL